MKVALAGNSRAAPSRLELRPAPGLVYLGPVDDEKAEERMIRTSSAGWFSQLARAYKLRARVVLVDDAKVGISPESETLLDMGKRAGLSAREWAGVLVSLGMGVVGAWVIVMAVLDPEPYSKVVSTIVAGAMLLGAGGFAAIRILTHHKPPKVTISGRGFEIAWD